MILERIVRDQHEDQNEDEDEQVKKAYDVPSWALSERPLQGESGKAFADRLMNRRYRNGNWEGTGPDSEHSKIKKYYDRSKR